MAQEHPAPLFRLFKLKIKADQRDAFVAAGQHNLQTSIENEAGTLAMYATHVDAAGTANRVVEIYRDQTSYDTHAKSPQFSAFKDVAEQAVTDQTVINLTPVLLLELKQSLRGTQDDGHFIQLHEFTLQAGKEEAYRKLMQTSLRTWLAGTQGILATYIGRSVTAPQNWVRFDVYTDLLAYQTLCQSAGYRRYQAAGQDMVQESTTTILTPDTLVNQGGLVFEG
ncbi:putative quinol monooxygenase [Levilactobacillus tongjiangensis]|uniref:Quinol monooxygenase n=1 Tax=Levilactobacillus tongjiangensis TaxID=2486023 RepID=A0ABW1SUM2_9LACO|nr:antibiotic biosynthesis monooxygenase family protein [Levilactobacillus tongjiangensis]